ncbi:hypothetical protein BHE97_13190 [Aeromicrobium sp. PE09-221]|uniref:DUF5667 domain-containing protein n=1 Tax=Aeromicrobium sp. PE09-221 TaxID=1898043 RepID=UPI000B3EB2BF|nr:DUF5667 domain-containing protein [Aeromicrobium sp. PE09-221]OUZ08621.1 hypothetical protein BHE97_13190 [Aeromicrobium sp. PE09-221]
MFIRRRAAQAFADAWGSRRRPDDAEIGALVALARRLEVSATAHPDPAFREGLREQLIAAAGQTMVAGPPRRVVEGQPVSPGRRRARWAGAVVAATLALVGSVSASASAVPGDILYPVKMGTEHVERTFAGDDKSLGRLYLTQAGTRLGEAEVLGQQSNTNARTRVSSALEAFSDSAERGSALLLGGTSRQIDPTDAEYVAAFAEDSTLRLNALLERLSLADRASAERAVRTLADLGVDIGTVCPECTGDTERVAESVDNLLSDVQRTLAEGGPGATTEDAGRTGQPSEGAGQSGTIGRDGSPSGGDSGSSEQPRPRTTAPPIESLPIIALPEAKPPSSVGDVLSPVVGAVLGDDRQEGLVPSVLGVLGLRR